MLTAEMSHKHIYHLRRNCFFGKERHHFQILQIGNLTLQLCIAGVCVSEPGARARSVASAGVNTAQTIKADVCVWEHRSPHWSISLGVGSCEWFSKSCWSHWEPAAVNKHIKAQDLLQQGSAYCKNCPISCKSSKCTCKRVHTLVVVVTHGLPLCEEGVK